ncbi:MAG: hypothetical protein ACRC8P_00530 [Spiroplasma sp.]
MPIWQIILLSIALLFAVLSVFLWVWNITRAKKLREQGFVTPKTKTKKVKLPFKLDKFVSILGGIDNIVKASASKSKIKVCVVDYNKIDFDELKKIKNRGIFGQTNNVSIVLGNSAPDLCGMINDLITINIKKR